MWRKYRRDHAVGSGLIGDNSTDPLAAKSRTISVDEVSCRHPFYYQTTYRLNIIEFIDSEVYYNIK